MGIFPLYQPNLPFRGDADVFQRYSEVMENGIEVGQRVLAHTHEGIRILVRLSKEVFRAQSFVAVDELVNHSFLKYWR